jgi:hypothetical protein
MEINTYLLLVPRRVLRTAGKRIALAAFYVCATLEVNTVIICSTSSIRHFQFDFHSCLGAVSDTWPFITAAERVRQAECLPESATVVSKPIYCDLVLQ